MPRQCAGTNISGEPCKGTPLAGRAWCFAHDPELAERRREDSIRGGQGKSSKARARKQLRDAVMDLDDVAGLLSLSMQKVATGKLEPNVGNALGAMARALMTVREANEVEQQIEELRQAVERMTAESTGSGSRVRRIA